MSVTQQKETCPNYVFTKDLPSSYAMPSIDFARYLHYDPFLSFPVNFVVFLYRFCILDNHCENFLVKAAATYLIFRVFCKKNPIRILDIAY